MQLAILCGGLATRLGELSKGAPKALMDINGRPFLDLLVEEYRNAHFTSFVLLAGYLADQLKRYESADISMVVEPEPLGTGGAVINALNQLEDRFWLANGDTYLMAPDMAEFVEFSKGKPASIYLAYEGSFDKDVPKMEGDRITGFQRSDTGRDWVDAGLFSFSRDALEGFGKGNLNMEKDILSKMASKGGLYGFLGRGRLFDIGRPERLELFRNFMKEKGKRKAVLIDRDGTIMEHVHYINDPDKVVIRELVVEKLKEFRDAGYMVIMVSNQSGIRKGLITREQHDRVMHRMDELLVEKGLELDDVFFCFSADEDHDPRRKPGPGMIFEARERYGLDLSRCVMVGDREDVDMEAGRRAGVGRCYLVDDFVKNAKP
jgi:D-glycero-D-manno-heptose 1,7-bisphosphate phosphatase